MSSLVSNLLIGNLTWNPLLNEPIENEDLVTVNKPIYINFFDNGIYSDALNVNGSVNITLDTTINGNLTTNDILYTDTALTTTYPTAQTWLFDAGTSAKNPCYNTISCPSSISLNSSGVITNKTCNINPCS